MTNKANYITPAGHAKLLAEFERLTKIERPKVVQEVSDAAAQGDRSENAEYIYGKKRLREIDSRLRFLSGRMRDLEIIDPSQQKSDKVLFGAIVTYLEEGERERTWQIVGEDETEPSEGKISWKSPVGRALMHKRVGDAFTFRKPTGEELEGEVVTIRYPSKS